MDRVEHVERLMEAFAERTGLVGNAVPERYLWTDAFAVCNYLSLYLAAREERWLDLAGELVGQVHEVLGAYDRDDTRKGWLGGMDDREHARSPTRAGLRIGKRRPERGPDEVYDEHAEWDRDGQYFHYLTRWMHALQRMAEVTDEARYHRWAVELAMSAFNGFVRRSRDGDLRMFWKMSVDLDRPLVPSMGQHDPLDGWVTALSLAGSDFADEAGRDHLLHQASVYRSMLAQRDLVSVDPLGIGGLLVDAWRLFRIDPRLSRQLPGQSSRETRAARISGLIDAAAVGLAHVERRGDLDTPPSHRLGFRELGLALGIRAAAKLSGCDSIPASVRVALDRISTRFPLAGRIEDTWLDPENQRYRAWTDHRDINEVMLATCLAPAGYLDAAPIGEIQKEDSP